MKLEQDFPALELDVHMHEHIVRSIRLLLADSFVGGKIMRDLAYQREISFHEYGLHEVSCHYGVLVTVHDQVQVSVDRSIGHLNDQMEEALEWMDW